MSTISELIEVTLAPLPGNVEEKREIQSALKAIDFSKKDALPRLLARVEAISNLGRSNVIARVAADTLLEDEWNDVFINTGKVNQGLVEGRDLALMLSAVSFLPLQERLSICERVSRRITDQMSALERVILLVKYSAEVAPHETAERIQYFHIDDVEVLFSIVLLCSSKYSFDVIDVIGTYVKDQNIREKLALVCAEKFPKDTVLNIEKFQLREERVRAQIARICLELYPGLVAANIQKFDITTQTAILEIARGCAIGAAYTTAANIQKFGITDPEALKEIALLIAEQVGSHLGKYIQNFGIADESKRIEIAKVCARVSPSSIAANIQNFGIANLEALQEIALIIALRDNNGLAQHIKKFGIRDQDILCEIATLCAKDNPLMTAENLSDFNISNLDRARAILALCVMYNPRCLKSITLQHPLFDPLYYIVIMNLEDNWNQENAIYRLNRFINENPNLPDKDKVSEWVESTIKGVKNDEHTQRQLSLSIATALSILRLQLDRDQFTYAFQTGLIQAVYETRNPQHYLPLINEVALFSRDEIAKTRFVATPPSKLEGYTDAAALIRMLLSRITDNPAKILGFLNNYYVLFKDASKMRLLSAVLQHLRKEATLDQAQKEAILAELQQAGGSKKEREAAVMNTLRRLEIVFDLGKGALLKDFKTVEAALKAAINEVVPIRININNLEGRLDETFGKSHNPMAIWQYAAKMKQVNDPKVTDCLSLFVESVLSGTFLERRYALDQNPHLSALGQETVNRWQKALDVRPAYPPFDPRGWLIDVLITDRTHGEPSLEALEDYLRGTDEEIVNNRLLLSDPAIKPLQEACIALAKAVTREVQREMLIKIQDELTNLPYNRIKRAVKLQLQTLSTSLTLIDTDAPNQLLLCGTDIPGSCQDIDGPPELAKALLGYIMNGQTRLLAVVDEKGRIVARSMIRLLLDDQGNPVLFQEKLYGDSEYQQSIEELALAKSAQMNLPLMIAAPQGSSGTPLKSIGGLAPYEYSDGAAGVIGVQEGSQFTVRARSI
jgi:hypothetical protein